VIRHYSAATDGIEVERRMERMYDGEHVIVAVEVFDHEQAGWSARFDGTIGPWVVGPEDEVYAYLDAQGYEDFAQQYSIGPPDEDPDLGRRLAEHDRWADETFG
jgi:hypothetical protein